jgi:uncharacterized protein (DUF433 family)
MAATKTYVRTDEHDVMRVGGTRVPLESIVYPFREGRSPESIRQSFAALTLEDVYGAIAFYLANRDEVDTYVARQEALVERLRAEQDRNPSPVVERLRAANAARARNAP